MGTSLKSKSLRKNFCLAAHCISSSFGNKSKMKAKATRKISFSKLCQRE